MLLTRFSRLKYTNDANITIELAPLSVFWAEKCEEDADNNIYSQTMTGVHGGYFTGMLLSPRFITITGFIDIRESEIPSRKRQLEQAFNPTIGGRLEYLNTATETRRFIDCKVIKIPKVYWSDNQVRFDIQLEALGVFWEAPPIIEGITQGKKNFVFKTHIPNIPTSKDKMIFGISAGALSTTFNNQGDTESGFTATLKATDGNVLNPMIKNMVTGQQIKLLYDMQAYDTIEITSYPQKKRITINGENGFKYFDVATSNFFTMSVGHNEFGYFADQNIQNLEISISYIPQFLGVQ